MRLCGDGGNVTDMLVQIEHTCFVWVSVFTSVGIFVLIFHMFCILFGGIFNQIECTPQSRRLD